MASLWDDIQMTVQYSALNHPQCAFKVGRTYITSKGFEATVNSIKTQNGHDVSKVGRYFLTTTCKNTVVYFWAEYPAAGLEIYPEYNYGTLLLLNPYLQVQLPLL